MIADFSHLDKLGIAAVFPSGEEDTTSIQPYEWNEGTYCYDQKKATSMHQIVGVHSVER